MGTGYPRSKDSFNDEIEQLGDHRGAWVFRGVSDRLTLARPRAGLAMREGNKLPGS